MRDRVASLVAIALLALVATVSYWYSRSLQSQAGRGEAQHAQVDADADQVTMIQFDSAGRAKYKLFADKMTHYAQSDDVDLVKPRLFSLRPDQPRVQASALLAHMENDGERIRLAGNVSLTRDSPPGLPPLRVNTQAMLVLPDQDRYLTDLPVTVERGADTITAVGMDLNNVTQQVAFQSDVVDTIAPHKK